MAKSKKMQKGSAVEVRSDFQHGLWGFNPDMPWPRHLRHGTVTQVGKRKARVLFPIRVFYWLPIAALKVVGFDGDGSSVGWR